MARQEYLDDFDDAEDYIISDYVVRNGDLYYFTQNHTGFSWNSEEVDGITVSDFNTEDSYSINDYVQIYLTMNLLGRYSAWCDLFPDTFSAEKLSEDLEEYPWVSDLFKFLRQHETLETAFDDFSALDNLLWD